MTWISIRHDKWFQTYLILVWTHALQGCMFPKETTGSETYACRCTFPKWTIGLEATSKYKVNMVQGHMSPRGTTDLVMYACGVRSRSEWWVQWLCPSTNGYMDTYGTRMYASKENDGFSNVCLRMYISEVNSGFSGYTRVYRTLSSGYNN